MDPFSFHLQYLCLLCLSPLVSHPSSITPPSPLSPSSHLSLCIFASPCSHLYSSYISAPLRNTENKIESNCTRDREIKYEIRTEGEKSKAQSSILNQSSGVKISGTAWQSSKSHHTCTLIYHTKFKLEFSLSLSYTVCLLASSPH